MKGHQEPLYRRENKTARGTRHRRGGSYRQERRTRERVSGDATSEPMGTTRRLGVDYTPLFRFLLSKVGSVWDDVASQAIRRLDRPDPIFWMVALHEHQRRTYVRVGDSTFFSGLYVDDDSLLQRVDPGIGPSTLDPSCACCTHTFNGVPFTRPYRPGQPYRSSDPSAED